MSDPLIHQALVSLLLFAAVYVFVRYAGLATLDLIRRKERQYDRVLNKHLLLDIPPRVALGAAAACVILTGAIAAAIVGGLVWFVLGAILGMLIPNLVILHMEQKRLQRLDEQIVDGITTLASGVRAGLNLVQAMELLVKNSVPPIRQEFEQLLREYQMGIDLNQAMRNTSNRIGSGHYRMLFTAIEMHRLRGGDAGESLDRIAESIREIQRLEGKLDALTSQGRIQAWMMAGMPIFFLTLIYAMDPRGVSLLFTEPVGRVILLVIATLIVTAFFWIRRILSVDI
ncbi:MAG: type II secretion system F family protein [Planctomycetes bacterium]|nr:type II secretion system F family protein [Planctomycetota bacterium]